VSATSKLVASIATNRRPPSQAPFVPGVASGTAAPLEQRFHRFRSESLPGLGDRGFGRDCLSSSQEPSLRRLLTSRRITSSYESAKYKPIAITYRTITCAGSRRERFPRRPARVEDLLAEILMVGVTVSELPLQSDRGGGN
jgi:hypothetical protein